VSTGRSNATWVDLQVAGARWLAYLIAALGFVFLWLVVPDRIAFSISNSLVPSWAGLVIAYNLLITGLAYQGWLARLLPTATLVMDSVLAGSAYLILRPGPDIMALLIDPLFLVMLLPVISAAVRVHWTAGMLAGLAIGMARAAAVLRALSAPLSAEEVLAAVFSAFLLLGVGFLAGYVADHALRQGARRQIALARRQLQGLQASLDREQAMQRITGTLGGTLSFEDAMASSLEVVDHAMGGWSGKARTVGAVFLFDSGTLRLATSRGVPRHELGQKIPGKEGAVAQALRNAELTVVPAPADDPELASFTAFADCRVAVVLPLRIGFESFGALVLGTDGLSDFAPEQLDYLAAVAERATVVLHNAMLYQNLQVEKDRIMRIEEDARHRLSRDLHDGPTQGISAVAMRVHSLRKMAIHDPQKTLAELEVIENLARQTVREIRQMLFTMRPLILETQGLMPALQALADKFSESDGLKIQIHETGDATRRLDGKQAAVIFYVVEEALGNARKYSQASKVEVRLWADAGLFAVQIRDDGVGFDAAKTLRDYEGRGSLGMINMRERAELINGSLDVKSAPGQGTTITMITPLAPEAGA